MIARAIMPHIFSPRAAPVSSCPDEIRASISPHEMFLDGLPGQARLISLSLAGLLAIALWDGLS
jgi:hypothetical protein